MGDDRPMYARVDPEFAGSPVWGVNGAIAALLARVAEVEAERDRLRGAIREALPVLLGNDDSNDDWAGTIAALCRLVGLRYPAGEGRVEPRSIAEMLTGEEVKDAE